MPEILDKQKPRDNFRFWFPIDEINIEKAVTADGKETKRMILGGIASTKRKDTDQESIAQNFDLSYLQERGIVNWNHSKEPEDIIGEPKAVKMVEKGLYVRAELYPESKKAQKVFELAEVLKRNGTRRLGYSIEGKALSRDPMDPSIVTKALVTNIALTISPKNPDSIVDILKGNFHGWSDDELAPKSEGSFDFDANGGKTHVLDITKPDGTRITVDHELNVTIIAKSMDTTNARAVIKEDLDKKIKDQTGVDKMCKSEEGSTSTYLSKEEVVERLMTHSVIDIEKANQIFENLNNLAMSAENNKTKITDDMLEKAITNVSKLTGEDETPEGQDGKEDITKGESSATVSKASNGTTAGNTATAKAKDEDEGENADANAQDDGKSKDVPKKGKAMKKANENEYATKEDFDNFQKSVLDTLKSIGILAKGSYDIAKANNDELQELQSQLDETPGRKSMKTVPKERNFSKGIDGDDLNNARGSAKAGRTQVSISKHKNQVVNMMDKVVFKGGTVNQEFAKGLTRFESANDIIDANLIKAVEDEFNVELCK